MALLKLFFVTATFDGRGERTLREVLHIWLSTYQKVRRMNE